MPEHRKPPLGIMPRFLFYEHRITDLHESIGRYLEDLNENGDLTDRQSYMRAISKWALELYQIAELEGKE